MQVAEGFLDGALVAGCGVVVFLFEGGVADVGFAEFAPVFWLRGVSFGRGKGTRYILLTSSILTW